MSLEINTSAFEAAFGNLRNKLVDAAVQSMHDATDDLLTESSRMAPLDKGFLRGSAFTEVNEADGVVSGEVNYSATEGGFNYALYMHEFGGKSAFANPTTPGTQPKYLSEPLKANSDKYKQWFAEDIRKALRGI